MFPLIATLICVYLAHSFTLLGSPAFVRNFSTQNNDNNPHVLELPDGDLIFAHESSFISGGSAATDMVVYRLDNRGIVKWSKRIGTTESNSLTSITATTDGNIALLGSANYDPANIGWHLTVLSGEGSILLSKVYYCTDITTAGMRLAAVPNGGGFVMIGRAKFAPSVINKVVIVKVSNAGVVEWSTRMEDTLQA